MALYASWSPGIAFMPAEFPGDTVQVNNVAGSQIVGLRQSGGAEIAPNDRTRSGSCVSCDELTR